MIAYLIALRRVAGVPDVFTDIDDLLELEQLDAVIIATPNHLHEPHVLSALRARLQGYDSAGVGHVLVEPAEREIEDWLRAVERVAKAGGEMLESA